MHAARSTHPRTHAVRNPTVWSTFRSNLAEHRSSSRGGQSRVKARPAAVAGFTPAQWFRAGKAPLWHEGMGTRVSSLTQKSSHCGRPRPSRFLQVSGDQSPTVFNSFGPYFTTCISLMSEMRERCTRTPSLLETVIQVVLAHVALWSPFSAPSLAVRNKCIVGDEAHRSLARLGPSCCSLCRPNASFAAVCAMHRRVPCCSRNGALQCLLPPFAQGPTEHLMDKCRGPSRHHSVSRCKGKLEKQKTTHRSPSPGAVPTALVVRRWSPSAWHGQRLACCRGMRSHWALPGHLPSPSSPHSPESRALICWTDSTTVSLHTPWVDVVSKIRCLCSDHSFISVHCPAAMGTRGWYVRTLFADNQ